MATSAILETQALPNLAQRTLETASRSLVASETVRTDSGLEVLSLTLLRRPNLREIVSTIDGITEGIISKGGFGSTNNVLLNLSEKGVDLTHFGAAANNLTGTLNGMGSLLNLSVIDPRLGTDPDGRISELWDIHMRYALKDYNHNFLAHSDAEVALQWLDGLNQPKQ